MTRNAFEHEASANRAFKTVISMMTLRLTTHDMTHVRCEVVLLAFFRLPSPGCVLGHRFLVVGESDDTQGKARYSRAVQDFLHKLR